MEGLADVSPLEGLEDISPLEGLEDTSPLEGLEDINIPFVEIPNMRNIVKSQYAKLYNGRSDQQYLVFRRVSVDGLAKIDRARNSSRQHTRMAHYADTGLLIVKFPTAEHEAAHGNLATQAIVKLVLMGMPVNEFHFVGATRFYGRNSSKEADSSYNPYSRRPNRTN